MSGRDDTLIVSATFDDSYPEWFEALPDPKLRVSTAEGGHPSQAFIRAFQTDTYGYRSYLFLQDSLEPLVDDVVAPFREKGREVVGLASFPLFFDNPEQEARVVSQYPIEPPKLGIFGPIFYATRNAMKMLERHHMFPKAPRNKMDAQGTERAWAYAFQACGYQVHFLAPLVTSVTPYYPEPTVFRKHFGGRA